MMLVFLAASKTNEDSYLGGVFRKGGEYADNELFKKITKASAIYLLFCFLVFLVIPMIQK